MKAKFLAFVLVFGFLCGSGLYAQGEMTPATEAGEDLDLYGVLELFRVAENLEALEKALNEEASEVNNLDLDGNGEVDYIRLEEHVSGNAHVIVLQVPLGENDFQDVADIEIEKLGENDYTLQIVGNEELYGPNYIIEPNPEAGLPDDPLIEHGYQSDYEYLIPPAEYEELLTENLPVRSVLEPNNSAVVIVIGAIPCVRIMFRPGYRPWISPIRWLLWPRWWRPWRPVARSIHRSRVRRFNQRHWRTTTRRRSTRSRNMYQTQKKSSPKAAKGKPTRKKKAPDSKNKAKTTKKKKKAPGHSSNIQVKKITFSLP